LPPAAPRKDPVARPAEERLTDWRGDVLAFDVERARAQAARCIDCGVPGCRNACPAANRIPDWMQALARGDTAGAAAILDETSALPEVCGTLCPQHRLCEGGCTRSGESPGLKNGAVTIGALEHWLGGIALDTTPSFATSSSKKVAVIGAGPSGLACADRLTRAGVAVTVYDRHPVAGGLLATGVPPFRLDKALLAKRCDRLAARGVRFELGTSVDGEHLKRLLAEYDAIFLGTGAQCSRPVDLPGKELALDALQFLGAVNAGTAARLDGKSVVVLGGGNSAMDCARSARRLGAAAVSVATRAAFRASPREQSAAREEGITLLKDHQPVALIGNGVVSSVQFSVTGKPLKLDADAVIFALGQVPAPPAWLAAFAVALDESGRIIVDAHGRTSHSKIYAGGDNVRGPELVVTAMADGRRAAEGMLRAFSLRGQVTQRMRGLMPPSIANAGAQA
jgi:glutamate synthase (NADPH/NADH) small chain